MFGHKKTQGVEGGAAPPAGELGGAEPPHLITAETYSAGKKYGKAS